MILQQEKNFIMQRIDEYKACAVDADQVVIALGCSDSRVRFPTNLVKVHNSDGTQIQVLFVFIPTIGGGAPSRSRMKRVLEDVREWGVPAEKLRILVTQHGNTQEISQRIGRYGLSKEPVQLVSCGLRKFFAQFADELSYLHTILSEWGDRYKQQTNNPRHILDNSPLSVVQAECPEAYGIICELSEKSGSDKYKLPRRLILRAAYRNATFDIEENGEAVRAKVAEYLREQEFSDIFATCAVGLADYDHNEKTLHFSNKYTSLNWQEKTVELGLPKRTVAFQDPTAVTITFSRKLLPIADVVFYPDLATQPDNTFRAVGSTPTAEILLCAFAEASYAVLHHQLGHDENFKSLSQLTVICDSPEYVEIAQNITSHTEFQADFANLFSDFLPNGFELIDISI